ncbi:MAG: pantoate--beta-alanine ligase [Thermoguttaceae bacterium]
MDIIYTVNELRECVTQAKRAGKCVGTVPTMGALHAGHISLVEAACQRCDFVIVTIFVNPTQFAPHEDFTKYPRTREADVALIKTASRSSDTEIEIVVFAPSASDVYPDGFATEVHITSGVSLPYEGATRPTHFRGVATVVLKLFLMSGADVAFFGEKDFQQLAVVKQMVRDLNVQIEIVGCPIVREEDGLAMSSRNRYLTPVERRQALYLSRSLATGRRLIDLGVTDADAVRKAIRATILEAASESGGSDVAIDYVAIADPNTLQEQESITSDVVVLLAVRIGATRLIDNTVVGVTR